MQSAKRDKLRIAQISPLWTAIPPATYGGIELLLALLCDELVARGHSVTLFGSGDCRTRANLHSVIPQNLSDRMGSGEALMHEYYLNAAMADALAQQDAFDVIHCHATPTLLPLAASAKKPCVFTYHTSPHADDLWALQRYPQVHVAAISHAQFAGASSQLGRAFPVIYNGIDFSAYMPSFEPGRFLAFLGRMSPEKNPLGAIHIAQQAGMPIVLAGKPQEYFRTKVQPLIDGERVKWIGPANHAQKIDLLRHAPALIFPIQWDEPFGLVMIEAMACGCPVVAVRRGSVGEVVDEAVTGFSAADIAALPELIASVIKLDRTAVRAQAEKRFSHAKMVDDYETLYRQICV
jgi:glycosyltransferase involved in cell wall biosynthesis